MQCNVKFAYIVGKVVSEVSDDAIGGGRTYGLHLADRLAVTKYHSHNLLLYQLIG